MVSWVCRVSPTADRAMPEASRSLLADFEDRSGELFRGGTVASIRCAVSAEADEAEAIRASVDSAVSLSVAHVAVSEAEASLMASITSPMAPAKSAAE
jgi:hypothetical protein